eukprot:GDKH01017599.1.p1 GENE.GDKH01017599.1~~GDKH01017599.1.p1  ORF type:complete len:51 (+),score=1.56 GDKH01017599.1:46-198(+)
MQHVRLPQQKLNDRFEPLQVVTMSPSFPAAYHAAYKMPAHTRLASLQACY